MDPRVIFYIIIGLVYVFIQYNKAKKKREEQMKRSQRSPDSQQEEEEEQQPIQPPTPQKDRDIFTQIFEEARQQAEERRPKQQQIERQPDSKPQMAESKPQVKEVHKPMVLIREERKVLKPKITYQSIAEEKLDENYTDKTLKDMATYEKDRPKVTMSSVASAIVAPSEEANLGIDNFDLKQAVLAQVILERKY